MRKSVLLAAAAAITLAAPALAHRQWMLPSTTILSGTNEWVTIDAAISNDLFYPDHFPMQTQQVKVWAPDGASAQIENATTGRYRSTFDVRIDKAGTWKIGTESSSVGGSFKANGAEWRVGGRRGPPGGAGAQGNAGGTQTGAGAGGRPAGAGAPQAAAQAPRPAGEGPGGAPRPSVASVAEIPANATDVKLTEVSNRNYVFVTAGAPSNAVFTPTNKGLELQPITHPDELVSNEDGQFRYLIDGKPAAGVKVTVVPGSKRFRATEGAQELTTGADGVLRVKWPTPGVYWISATASDNRPTTPRATDRRMSYTMTVEVPAP